MISRRSRRSCGAKDVAVFLVEPVQGKGVHLPPPGYLEGAQELCRRYGTLFAVDEVQTGFGRTGRVFAFQHWGLEPDLVPVAKSLSGGYVPVGGLLMSRAVHEAVFDSMAHAVSHGSTFAPNELGMAAGLATLRELRAQRLVEESARRGELLLELTRPLVEDFDVASEVRGLGLMWAIEFAEPPSGKLSWRLIERMQKGLFALLVVGPLFSKHRILTCRSPATTWPSSRCCRRSCLSDEDVAEFAGALRSRRSPPAAADAESADEVRALGPPDAASYRDGPDTWTSNGASVGCQPPDAASNVKQST